MKKLSILVASIALFIIIACVRAQAQSQPCTPTNTLTLNTGVDVGGTLLGFNAADPFWGGYTIANLTGSMAQWNAIPGTKILSPTFSNNGVVGIQTFKRPFYLCREATVKFSGVYRDDNMVKSVSIKTASGGLKWSQTTGLPTNDPQCYKDNSFGGSVTLPGGDYYLEFVYDNTDGPGGFALAATMTAPDEVLANFKNCCPPPCANCSLFQSRPEINGPATVKCDSPARFSLANCPDVSYNWTVTPTVAFTGQGTSAITLTPPFNASSYTITVVIRCGTQTATASKTVNLPAAPAGCSPAFLPATLPQANGIVNMTATCNTPITGVEHYWGMVYNGTYPNCNGISGAIPLADIQSGLTYGGKVSAGGAFTPLGMGTGKSGSASSFTYNGFGVNSCFKITHYVRCGCTWMRQTWYISTGVSNLKTASGTTPQPQMTKSEVETVQ